MAESSKRKTHAERVFEHLRHQTRALSAYQILDDLRDQGVTAATTVYRALDQLVASGRVHRIEILNAFTVCVDPRHSETPVFEISKDCGDVTERSPPVDRNIAILLGSRFQEHLSLKSAAVAAHVGCKRLFEGNEDGADFPNVIHRLLSPM